MLHLFAGGFVAIHQLQLPTWPPACPCLQLDSKGDVLYCENFALTVFNRADRVDRAGRADKATAVTFYAASYFFEVSVWSGRRESRSKPAAGVSTWWTLQPKLNSHLPQPGNLARTALPTQPLLLLRSLAPAHTLSRPQILRQFGDPQPDTVQKQRYAAWRAAEINKAVKEGRKPEPPPVARADTEEESAMLDELSKLEMASASSAPASTPAASAAPPAAPAPTVSGRLAGLPSPVDDWGASSAVLPQVPAPRSDSDSESLDLPSPPKQRPVESQNSGGVWMPPPPRRLQTFQKVGGAVAYCVAVQRVPCWPAAAATHASSGTSMQCNWLRTVPPAWLPVCPRCPACRCCTFRRAARPPCVALWPKWRRGLTPSTPDTWWHCQVGVQSGTEGYVA